MIRSLWWLVRRKIAIRNHDTCMVTADKVTQIYTPFLLRILGLELLKVQNTNPTNKIFTCTEPRLLIRKINKEYNMNKPVHVWRIQGDDITRKPMVLWERSVI